MIFFVFIYLMKSVNIFFKYMILPVNGRVVFDQFIYNIFDYL